MALFLCVYVHWVLMVHTYTYNIICIWLFTNKKFVLAENLDAIKTELSNI